MDIKLINYESPEKSANKEISQQQIEIFYEQYSISKYEERSEQGRDQFIVDLKYWINKLEAAEKLKTKCLSLRNSLVSFTGAEIFQHQAQLEIAKTLLPFLKAQLALTQSMQLPKLRKDAILPLGSLTAREMLLQVAERVPDIAQLSQEEQLKHVNQSIQKVGELVSKIDLNTWAMDTTTLNSLKLQQWRENIEKHRQLMILREKLLKDIENSPTDLPHEKRVILQRQSVEVGLRIVEFEKWIKENSIEVHVEPEKPTQQVEEITAEKSTNVRKWRGTKSEFCQKIKDDYDKNRGKYKSVRDATYKIFPKYIFEDKDWKVEQCYELLKKLP